MAQWGIGGSKARGRHERPPPCHLILPLTLLLYSVHTHCLLSPNSLLLTPFLPKSILPSTIHIYFFLIEFLSCPLPSWHAPPPPPFPCTPSFCGPRCPSFLSTLSTSHPPLLHSPFSYPLSFLSNSSLSTSLSILSCPIGCDGNNWV